MTVSVIITTRDRATDLQRTCDAVMQLRPAPNEVLVTADGCTDGTVDMVADKFPEITLIANQPGIGSVASRDRMMREARRDLVLALDDDSYPEQRSEEHTSELQSQSNLVCRLLLEKKKTNTYIIRSRRETETGIKNDHSPTRHRSIGRPYLPRSLVSDNCHQPLRLSRTFDASVRFD